MFSIFFPFVVNREAGSNVGNAADDGWGNQLVEAMDATRNLSVEDMDATRNQPNENIV